MYQLVSAHTERSEALLLGRGELNDKTPALPGRENSTREAQLQNRVSTIWLAAGVFYIYSREVMLNHPITKWYRMIARFLWDLGRP